MLKICRVCDNSKENFVNGGLIQLQGFNGEINFVPSMATKLENINGVKVENAYLYNLSDEKIEVSLFDIKNVSRSNLEKLTKNVINEVACKYNKLDAIATYNSGKYYITLDITLLLYR